MKKIFPSLVFIFIVTVCYAQKANWQNLDQQQDSLMGISTEKAYFKLLKGKKAIPVIVAVLDAGVDTSHENLKSILWTRRKSWLEKI